MDAQRSHHNAAVATSDKEVQHEKLRKTLGFIPTQHLFLAVAILLVALFSWPLRWFLAGAPLLTYSILAGAAKGHRVLPFIPLWTLVALINLSYSVAATSWLLYWVYAGTCYPSIFLSCLFQFDVVSRFVRKKLRAVLRGLEFINDKIAFFDLPALEIDVDVEGLMCIRGITFSLSSLTLIAHGVEVGIKFSDDMEIALVTDKVTIKLFRRIDIEDVYGNVKGGQFEMTFGKLAKKSNNEAGEALMVSDTPLLAAAAATGDMRQRPGMTRMQTMTEQMTGGHPPKLTSVKSGLQSVTQISADDEAANKKYLEILEWMEETSIIHTSRLEAEQDIREAEDGRSKILDNDNDLRAAICSQLHDKPTIPHPAKRSIKVSAIQNLTPPHIRAFLHRLPLLLRLLLNPIAYFHPVFIKSITAGGSGGFLQHVLQQKVFTGDSESGIKNLKQRISAWLSDANFIFEAVNIYGQASVPINTVYDIVSELNFDDIMAYRTLPKEVDLKQIIRLGGADAKIAVPSFLLPHHEHLLPPPPTKDDEKVQREHVEAADGQPKTIQALHEMKHILKDDCSMTISTHVRLPACFDQSLLDFIAALVKATKIIELEKDEGLDQEERKGFRAFTSGLKADMKDGMRRAAIDVAANDKWIAKLVGKVTRKMETMQGDIGYSGEVPIPLAIYREKAETASKLMV